MAVSLAQYVDLLVKKLYGVAKTDDAANKSPSNESIPSPPLLRGDIVWTQSDQIANTAQVTSGITQSYLGTGTIQCSPDTTTVPIGGIYPTWLTGLTNWIPQEFGSTWPVKVYVDTTGAANAQVTGTQIFAPGIGGVGEFFFDTQAGLLNFIGDTIPTTLTAGKSIFIAGYRYVGLLGTTHLPGNTTIGNLVIANTTITTNQTNGNVIIAATGNGYAQIAGSAGIAIPYGNTNQRPHTPLEGTIRYNSVDLVVEVYTGNAWATVGSGGGNNTYNISSQTISSADGSAVTFTLDQVTETENILVSINGIGQSPTVNYTVAADQLTFSEAPQPSDIIEIRFISPAPAAGTVTSGTQYHIPYYANTGSTVSDSGGNLTWNGTNLLTVRGAITATGNITGNYILGNGSQLTGIAGAYGNANVANYLPTFSGNLTAGNISASGNVTGNYILGNIAFANGIPATYGNSNVANYLPTYSGNITAGNVSVTGNVYGNNFIITVTETVTGNVTAGNILTGGLVSATGNITGNFILGNGSQLTGLPATYGNANVANYLPTFSGNLTAGNISASGNIAGNFILGNIAFANGIPATYGNANVKAYAEAGWAGNIVPSANVTYTLGNSTNWWANAWFGANTIYVGGAALSQSNGNLSFNGNSVVTANASGTSITTGNVSIIGNITASYVLGNGSQLTGIVSSYSNANVANYLPTYSGNLTAGNVSTTGNIAGNYFIGNGSQLSGLPATYSNSNVSSFMTSFGSNTISSTGNITTTANIASGNISATTQISSNIGKFFGDGGGYSALNVGLASGFTQQLRTIIQTSGNFNGNAQINIQNIGTGPLALTRYAATPDNGSYNDTYIHMGISSSSYNQSVSNPVVKANDGYVVVSGNTQTGGGNLVLGTNGPGLNDIVFVAGGPNANAIVARITGSNTTFLIVSNVVSSNSTTGALQVAGGVGVVGNVYAGGLISATGNVYSGNLINVGSSSVTGNITAGNVLTGGIVSSTGNSTAANYLTGGSISATGNITGGNISAVNHTGTTVSVTGNVTAGNVINTGVSSVTGNITGGNIITAGLITATGNITGGNIAATSIAGTLTTAAQTNITSVGTLSALTVTANITGGNVLTSGIISSAGNITGGNISATSHTGITVSVSGNVTGGNVLTSGVISSTGNIVGGNISATTHTGTTVSVTGNITAGNVLNTGISSVTGNITAGNVLTAGLISATGNISANNANITNYLYVGSTVSNLFKNVPLTVTGANAGNTITGINIVNTGGGGGSGSGIDFYTYVGAGYPPEASIYSVDNADYSANINFATKIPGAGANILATRMTVASNGNVVIPGNLNVGNVIINGQPTTYGYVNGAYLLAQNTTDQSVGLNVAVNFQTTSASNGSIITKTSNSQVTLTAGNTYKLEGIIRRLSSSSTWAAFRWYDVTNSAYVGIEGFSEVTNSPGAIGSTNVATYIVTPTVNTIYELRQTTVNTISVSGGYAGYEITQINPAIAVQATATGTVAATVVANTSPVTTTATGGSSTSPALTVLTLAIPTAGTWRLDAELRVSVPGTGYMAAAFYDNGTLIPGSEYWVAGGATNGGGAGGGQYGGFMSYNLTTTGARTVTMGFWASGSTVQCISSGDGRTWARATQLDSIFALNTLDTMSTTGNVSVGGNLAVTGNIAGTALKITAPTFQAVTPDWTLSDSASATYFLLGTWNTSQAGNTLYMRMVAHVGYNAVAIENQVTELMFATSNGSAYTTGSSGNFYGNGLASINSRLGTGGTAPTYKAPQTFRIIQVSNTQYQIYCYFAAAYMRNSTYSIQISSGDTWVDGGGGAVSAPSGNYITITPTAF